MQTKCAAAGKACIYIHSPRLPIHSRSLVYLSMASCDLASKHCPALAAGDAPDDMAAGAACCYAAQPVGAANCSCWALPDDANNTAKTFFGAVAQKCTAAGLAVNIPSCVQSLLAPPSVGRCRLNRCNTC